MSYRYEDIVRAFRGLGLESGQVVYVISSLWRVPGLPHTDMTSICEEYAAALAEVIGSDGTVVVPTSSLDLCGTETVFDPATTPSFERGAFAEHIRQSPEARRSFHPFASYAALGRQAAAIVDGASRHAYGPNTPEARMIEMGAMAVNIGGPKNICTTVHHCEQVMGVPYRYTKEFDHPVRRDGSVSREPFYLYALYRDIGVERDYNKQLFEKLAGRMEIREAAIGKGRIYTYALAEFFQQTVDIMTDDIYVWCRKAPKTRPYRD